MKKIFTLILSLISLTSVALAEVTATAVPAFPGAEGFGRYTTGGRGGTVYHVTTLEDTGEAGSFRYACSQKGARIIVFDVCGTIYLKSTLNLSNDNVTIAGQTAPGDGVCIADYPFQIRANNVVIRYMRFRCGNRHVDEHEGDGLGAMDKDNIIVDHCSISWSVDECCSVYGGKNITVQWSIVAQSMVNAGHSKGAHGYGGNWGGSGCTYAHNLLLHHTSRTPRLGPRPYTQCDERLDLRNNVIYNWGGNGCYGGEGMNVNIVNNYWKPGPATGSSVGKRIAKPNIRTTAYCEITEFNADGTPANGNGWAPMWHVWGHYYVEGNVNPKYSDVTNNNWTVGVVNHIDRGSSSNDGTATDVTMDTIHSLTVDHVFFPYTTTWSAEDAYEKVLGYVGCCKDTYRHNGATGYALAWDRLDSVMISDTRNGVATYTGDSLSSGFINSQADCGGWPELYATDLEISRASTDSDKDGIPDYYEDQYFSNTDVEPNAQCTKSGYTQYTNMDYYLARLCQNRITRYISPENSSEQYISGYQALGEEVGSYVWDESVAAIQSVSSVSSLNDGRFYDLSGRIVEHPVKGIVYVRNGKLLTL